MTVEVAELHAPNVYGQHGDEKDHLHEEVDEQAHVGERAKLLDRRHHCKEAAADDHKLAGEDFSDKPAFFLEAECDPVADVEVEGCGHYWLGQGYYVLEADEDDEVGEDLAAVEGRNKAEVGADANRH